MARPDRLGVFSGDAQAGELRQDRSGSFAFAYRDDYIVDVASTPVSLSMPLLAPTHSQTVVDRVFRGLLPENPQELARLARAANTSEQDAFGLLAYGGRDVAGALQLLPPGEAPDDAGAISWLSPDLLAAHCAVLRADAGSTLGEHGPWSLTGVQPKLALRRDGERWGIPSAAEPTTHILKPAVTGMQWFDVHEAIVTRAAANLGLMVADSELLVLADGTHAFVTRRFDRRPLADGRVLRVHQEDLCQALSYPSWQKYEIQGGPGVARIARLFAGFPRSVADDARRRFYDALVFNLLVGNTDGHAKNLSLLLQGPDVALAPMYDLNSALPYTQPFGQSWAGFTKLHSAFRLGSQSACTRVTAHDLAEVATQLSLDADAALQRAAQLRVALPAAVEEAARAIGGGLDLHLPTSWPDMLAAYHATFADWGDA